MSMPTFDANGNLKIVLANAAAAARVTKSAVQSIPNTTDTLLTWDVEQHDIGGLHSNVTNNSRLTATKAGVYQISAVVQYAANATGHRYIYFFKNNATILVFDIDQAVTTAATTTVVNVSIPEFMAVGDYVEVYTLQNSGAALNVNTLSSTFGMALVTPSAAAFA